MKFIAEQIYYITYNLKGCSYESERTYLADSIEDAIAMCKEENEGCFIKRVSAGNKAKRRTTKTITVDI